MRILLPEQVEIEFKPASFGSRSLAYMLDFLIRWGTFALIALALIILSAYLFGESSGEVVDKVIPNFIKRSEHPGMWIFALLAILYFFVEWSYPIYFELFHDGVTPGKHAFGLRVVDERGLSISARASIIRNIIVVVDQLPLFGLVGLVSMLASARSQRLGDLAASTLVVHDQSEEDPILEFSPPAANQGTQSSLPIEVYAVLESYLKRARELTPHAQEATRQALVRSITPLLPPSLKITSCADDQWLSEVYRCVHPQQKRYTAAHADYSLNWGTLGPELHHATQDFAQLKSKQTRLYAGQLREIAESYQKLCQRHAYLSTFYPKTEIQQRVARLVLSARRLVYGTRLSGMQEPRVPFWQRAPRAFEALRSYCVFSVLVGVLSGVLTSLMVQINPHLSWSFISEEVAAELAKGHLWTEQIQGISSLASSQIMTNNISVSFAAFAFGITGGIGTLLVPISNGAHLGGIFTALVPYHMAGSLFEFVIAHGFLELSVIFVAGGCGLAIGDALLRPGFSTRKEALQQRARTALDLLIFSALCLIPAGIVEGFVSPYQQIPFVVKLILGLSLGTGYWWFLIRGGKHVSAHKVTAQ